MPSKTVTPVASSAEDSSTPEAVEPTPFIPLTSLNPLLPEIDVSENEVHDYDEEQVSMTSKILLAQSTFSIESDGDCAKWEIINVFGTDGDQAVSSKGTSELYCPLWS
jgi:hypothetical protein